MSPIFGKDYLRVSDFSASDVWQILRLAHKLKKEQKRGLSEIGQGKESQPLRGKTLVMIFEKPSTRTRLSFEIGVFQLGGYAIYLSGSEVGLGKREAIPDVARVLSRMGDAVMIRSHHHWLLEEFAEAATVPVINGLSDHHHPCQALADVFTIFEHFSETKLSEENFLDSELPQIVYIGDGNNVCNSLMEICSLIGIPLIISSPSGYEPLLREGNCQGIRFIADPFNAIKGVRVVYTDTWISMGQEALTARKLEAFLGYKVTPELMSFAAKDAVFMHDLPAHRGYEVDEQVLDGKQSIIFEQAENRLHVQKALLTLLLSP